MSSWAMKPVSRTAIYKMPCLGTDEDGERGVLMTRDLKERRFHGWSIETGLPWSSRCPVSIEALMTPAVELDPC